MGGTLKLGRWFGVEVGLHGSWFLIALLVTVTLALGALPGFYPAWSAGEHWAVAVGITLVFCLSVLSHELAHALVARRMGITVRGITLFVFGGASQLDGEMPSPRHEVLVASAGPALSLVLGASFFGLELAVGQPHLDALLGWAAVINLALGAFNLLPGFPMDGGRMLRAALWQARGDRLDATRAAAVVGRFVGFGVIGLGAFVFLQRDGIVGGIWLGLIGWFLASAANTAGLQSRLERALRGLSVRDVMEVDPPAVSPNERVADLVTGHFLRAARALLVRHDDGGLAGLVTLGDVHRVARAHWEAARVTDIMTRWADLVVIGPDDTAQEALRIIRDRGVSQLPVVAEGRDVLGMVTRTGLLQRVEARLRLGV